MKIFLNCPSTEIIPLNVSPSSEKVDDVKKRIPLSALLIPAHGTSDPFCNIDNFQLVYNGVVLRERVGYFLSEYKLEEGSILNVVMKTFKVFVQTQTGKSFSLLVKSFDYIESVWSMLEKEGIQPHEQRLMFADRQLEDGYTLFHYNIQHNSILSLLPWTRGSLTLHIRTSTKKRLSLKVEATDTIDYIKSLINKQEDAPPSQQQLMHNGHELEGYRRLTDYNIHEESSLYLVLPSTVQIFVRDLHGRTIPIDVMLNNTIKSVKYKIYDKEGIPLHQQYLVYIGNALKDDRTLADYGIQANAIIDCTCTPVHTTITDERFSWNIENTQEVQVFHEPNYGVMLVIPPFSVPQGGQIHTTVRVIEEPSPDELPPNVQLASCFYEIATHSNFVHPIEFHMQHNVDLTICNNKYLVFVTRNFKTGCFEFFPESQTFAPNDNSGTIHIARFGLHQYGVVYDTRDGYQPVTLYAMTPFYKLVEENCWEVKIVITQNLQPYFEKMMTLFEGWTRKDPNAFHFNPNINSVTLNDYNQFFEIVSLKQPCKVDKYDVDRCTIDSFALPFLHLQVMKKRNLCELFPLALEFEGMSEKASIVIPQRELSVGLVVVVSKVSEKVLDREPKKKDLVAKLNPLKSMWKEIGEQLDVEDGELKTIEKTYNDTNRLSEVLQLWINDNRDVTWRRILKVIRNKPIGNNKIADDIMKFLESNDDENKTNSTFPKQQVIKNETKETRIEDMIREGKADYCRRCNRVNTKKVGWDQTYCTYCGEKIHWTDNAQKRQEDIVYLGPLKQSMPPKQELPTTRKIGWDCTLCTFKNLPYHPGCEICGTARPAGYVSPPDYVPLEKERKFMEKEGPQSLSGHAQFTGWECPRCTLKNLPHRPGCETCGTTRPAGYVPPPDYVPVGEDRRYSDKDEYDKQQILMFLENEHREQKEVAQRNYRDLLNADAIPVVVNEDVFKCPVCNGYINPGEGIRLRSCLHMICKNCLHDRVVGSNDPVVRCGFNNGYMTCQEIISEREISCVLSYVELEVYFDKSLRLVEATSDDSFRCKTNGCIGFCFYDFNVREFHCPNCGRINCIPCKAQHEGMSCQQYRGPYN